MDTHILHFTHIYKKLAEALKNIDFEPHEHGFIFAQKAFPHSERNFCFSTIVIEDLVKTQQRIVIPESADSKILTKNDYQNTNQYTLYVRSPQKSTIHPPPPGLEIRTFSFNTRKKGIYKILEKLDMLPAYFRIPEEEITEFERIPRALLHIYPEAQLHLIENEEQDILSLAISVSEKRENEQITSIHYLVTPEKLRRQGFATELIDHLIGTWRNRTILIIIPDNPSIAQFLRKLQFTKTTTWNMWIKQ